MGLIYPI